MAVKAKKKTTTKVRDLGRQFGIPPQEVLDELRGMGVELTSPAANIDDDVLELVMDHFGGLAERKLKAEAAAAAKAEADQAAEAKAPAREIHVKMPIVVKHLAETLDVKPNAIISKLMGMNILATINQTIEPDVAEKVCGKFGVSLVIDRREKDSHVATDGETAVAPEDIGFDDRPEDLAERPPVITFLGHVDHGKTSLQDRIRQSNVAEGEHGGITQHIGASVVELRGKTITFIDTPGHEAFTGMRARGANLTDIAVLVVAADDGFMPQTVEALSHARAAKVPIIVAINKMDLPTANPDKVLLQMQQNELMSEDWGGEVGVARVSAATGDGIEALLDRILLEAEMLQLKGNPRRPAEGAVIEAQLETGHGPTASILVRNGTLRKGDFVLCGEHFGRVKAMVDVKGRRLDEAGPSTPVKLVGLSGVPEAGAKLIAMANEREARALAEQRNQDRRISGLSQDRVRIDLESIMLNIGVAEKQALNLILKTDVRGSIEAIRDSLAKFPSEKIAIDILHADTGAITENDVLLAAASKAIIVGFHTRVNPGVNAAAKREQVEIRLYSIIYELIEDIREALTGRLAPEKREKVIGEARILQIFDVSKGPKVCGCRVESGAARVGSKTRVYRDEEMIYNGAVKSLRRFQDDVKEVKAGLECGIRLDNFLDFNESDRIQFYEVESHQASL
jgi:translation initiation factor IF-2